MIKLQRVRVTYCKSSFVEDVSTMLLDEMVRRSHADDDERRLCGSQV